MMEVDFNFYQEEYAGDIIPDSQAFKKTLVKANTYLNQMLHREPEDSTEEEQVKICLCEVSDKIYQDESFRSKHNGLLIQSENTDGYAVSYASRTEETLDTQVYSIIRRHLSKTGLLYLGVNCNDHKCSDYDF